jgi:hypothetical protein
MAGSNFADATIISVDSEKGFSLNSVVVLDGVLSAGEWADAAHSVQWYMDADPENSDGYNYMYLDEDQDYLYVALDLCSDQTNDENGEWVGVWLNTNQTQVFNESIELPSEWEAALNKGMESLVHDVENNETMPFFDAAGGTTGFMTSPDKFTEVNGTIDLSPTDLWSINNVYMNVTSDFNGTHYVTRVDIPIDFYEYFGVFKNLYVDHIIEVELNFESLHNVTISEHFLSVSDLQGNLNPLVKESMGTGTSPFNGHLEIYPGDFTSDSEIILSLNGVNSAPFNTSYDWMRVDVTHNATTFIAEYTAFPHTSIQEYDIAWSFGPSDNNASDHRQFEIKIPKSELEGYDADTDLGIIVGGYGTLVSFPNTHNWVYANNTVTGIPEGDSSRYNYYPMPLKGAATTTTTTETNTSTTITSTGTETTTPLPPDGDITQLLVIVGAGAAGVVVILLILVVRKK